MQFDSLSEIIAMGGYGFYVWSSVLIVVLVITLLIVDSATLKRRTLKVIKQELDRAEKIKRAKAARL